MNPLSAFAAMTTRAPAACIILIKGKEIKKYYSSIESIEVTQSLFGAGSAKINFSAGRDNAGEWGVSEDKNINSWVKIETQVVFDHERVPLFKGYIRQIDSDFSGKGSQGSFWIRCEDSLAGLERTVKHKKWAENKTDKQILTEILKKSPDHLRLSTDSDIGKTGNRHQGETDYRFILNRAKANNYEIYLRGNEVYFGPKKTTSSSQGRLLVNAGCDSNCDFKVNEDGYRPDAVITPVASRKSASAELRPQKPKQPLLGSNAVDSNRSGLSQFIWHGQNRCGGNAADANVSAQADAVKNSFKLSASGKLNGTLLGKLVLAGGCVEIDGVGKHSGEWYVESTRHLFDQNGYFIDFKLIRNATGGKLATRKKRLARV